jgi:hypothetical protein
MNSSLSNRGRVLSHISLVCGPILGGLRFRRPSSIVFSPRSIDPVFFVYRVNPADDPSTTAMMVSCKAVGPGVSGGEAGGGVDEESGAGVDMVMRLVVVDRTEADRFVSSKNLGVNWEDTNSLKKEL